MNTQTIEQLVFECGLQMPVVIVPAIALALLCAWLLFQERHHLGGFWVTAFWCLRAVALAVLVWMFLQPARVTETKSTLPQSVALIVDNSDSMRVVDPDDEGQSMRWNLANLTTEKDSAREAQTALDSALIGLEVAQQRWLDAQADFQANGDAETVKQQFELIAFALRRASIQLSETFREHWDDSSDQRRAEELALRCEELADFASDFRELSSEDDSAKQIQTSQQFLDDLTDLNRLAKTWSLTVSDSIAQSPTSIDAVDRKTRVMQLVSATEQSKPIMSESNLSIKRFTFDRQLTPVLSTEGWDSGEEDETIDEEEYFQVDQIESEDVPSVTDLSTAIEQLMQLASSQSVRSAVFLTDGAHNATESRSPLDVASKRNNLAITFVPIGSLKRPTDVQLYHVEHPRSVIRGDQIVIDALVSSDGFEGQVVNLQLWADEELIDEKELSIDADQIDLRHSFTVPTDQPGSIEFELKAEPLDGEISTANNRAIFKVGVVRDKIRVMLADRISRWEYRYLDQLLYRDEHLEHEMILFDPRLRATGKLKEDAAIPTTVEAWEEYDVALIGDLTPDQFPVEAQDSLVDYVKEKGGVAILIAGRSGMPHAFEEQPLSGLLPVEKLETNQNVDQFHVRVNRLAGNLESIRLDDSQPKSELLWQRVFEEQPITWLSEYSNPKPSARRLLDTLPADDDELQLNSMGEVEKPSWVCWQQLGAGRVVYLSAPDTYRLRYRRGDRLHHRFWAQLLRWITSDDPGSDNGRVQLTTDKVRYQQQDPIQVVASLADDVGEPITDAQLEVKFSGGDDDEHVFPLSSDETQPGRYVAKVEGLEAGAYRVTLQGEDELELDGEMSVKTFVNVVTSPNVERVNTTCNRPLMKQIAQASGGHVIPPTALAEWLTLQTGAPETISQIERQPLWNRWSSLWIAFGCLASEWFIRRVKGLT